MVRIASDEGELVEMHPDPVPRGSAERVKQQAASTTAHTVKMSKNVSSDCSGRVVMNHSFMHNCVLTNFAVLRQNNFSFLIFDGFFRGSLT